MYAKVDENERENVRGVNGSDTRWGAARSVKWYQKWQKSSNGRKKKRKEKRWKACGKRNE